MYFPAFRVGLESLMVGRKRDVGFGPAFGEDSINLADWRRADCCDRKGESFRWGARVLRSDGQSKVTVWKDCRGIHGM